MIVPVYFDTSCNQLKIASAQDAEATDTDLRQRLSWNYAIPAIEQSNFNAPILVANKNINNIVKLVSEVNTANATLNSQLNNHAITIEIEVRELKTKYDKLLHELKRIDTIEEMKAILKDLC